MPETFHLQVHAGQTFGHPSWGAGGHVQLTTIITIILVSLAAFRCHITLDENKIECFLCDFGCFKSGPDKVTGWPKVFGRRVEKITSIEFHTGPYQPQMSMVKTKRYFLSICQ